MITAFVDSKVLCPYCGSEHDNVVWFGWGLCGTSNYNRTVAYKPGDLLRWRRNFDGSMPHGNVALVPSWLEGSNQPISSVPCNIGDPTILDLVVPQTMHGGPVVDCGSCEKPFFSGVEISNGTVLGSITAETDSDIAIAALALEESIDQALGQPVRWEHGVADWQMSDVDSFLSSFDLPEAKELREEEESLADWATAASKKSVATRLAIRAGWPIFSERVLLFAIARRQGIDPFFIEMQLRQTLVDCLRGEG